MQNDIVLQEGKFGGIFGEQAAERKVINKSKELIESARSSQIPIFHICVRFKADYSDLYPNSTLLNMVKQMNALQEGTWGGSIVEELTPLENECLISHHRVGPFHGTDLKETLKKGGFESIILFGVATNVIVESTARVLGDEGFNVYVVEDCCSAATLQAHNASLEALGLLTNIVKLEGIFQTA